MAATTSQGKTFTIFIVGLTVACAGLAFIATGIAKLALLVGIITVGFSFAGFFKIKPLEGVPALGKQPAALKLGGLGAVLLGWLIVLVGLNLTASVTGRMITTLLGLAVSLVGVLVILPIAANKNAIWKS
jgi:hypothetical protein